MLVFGIVVLQENGDLQCEVIIWTASDTIYGKQSPVNLRSSLSLKMLIVSTSQLHYHHLRLGHCSIVSSNPAVIYAFLQTIQVSDVTNDSLRRYSWLLKTLLMTLFWLRWQLWDVSLFMTTYTGSDWFRSGDLIGCGTLFSFWVLLKPRPRQYNVLYCNSNTVPETLETSPVWYSYGSVLLMLRLTERSFEPHCVSVHIFLWTR